MFDNILSQLKKGLEKTQNSLKRGIDKLLSGSPDLDEDFFAEMEEILIGADVGIDTSLWLVENIRKETAMGKLQSAADAIKSLQKQITETLTLGKPEPGGDKGYSTINLIVGVNGVGKTTTIAKLAHKYKKEGKKVLLAAADTFRAAAIDQLQVWAGHLNIDVISHQPGSDPAAVTYDALQAFKARHGDVLIIDTAGRLHTKSNLMAELRKIERIIKRECPEIPLDVLLVLDATTGQNALTQAKVFRNHLALTGLILTKLDGTAKGGIVIPICRELEIPIKYIGLGENMTDLQKFSASAFVAALFEEATGANSDA